MKSRKAAALPTAVALCTILLLVSFVVSSLIIEMSLMNKLSLKESDRDVLLSKAYNHFVAHDGDITDFSDDTYLYKTYEGENNVKALVAYQTNSGNMVFYTIYDFNNEKTLAYQTSVTYITVEDNITYLGGIIPLED